MKNEKKRQRGRPEVAAEERRSVLLQFRVTQAEAAQIKQDAKLADRSVSNWLRLVSTNSIGDESPE